MSLIISLILIFIITFFYIIITYSLNHKFKNCATIKAKVLGYYWCNRYLKIALSFKDSEDKEHIILNNFGWYSWRASKSTVVLPYKIGSIINIKMIKKQEDYRIDKFLDSITLFPNNIKIQPTEDGDLYEIKYISNYNSKDFFNVIFLLFFTILLLILALFAAILGL